MFIRWKVTSANHLLLPVLVLRGLVGSCAPRLSPPLPPPDYKGPIAEQPIEDSGYVWVYESADGKKGTARNVFGNYYGFPLWVGKWWSYESGSSLEGTELSAIPNPLIPSFYDFLGRPV